MLLVFLNSTATPWWLTVVSEVCEPHGWSQGCLFGVHTNLIPFFFLVKLSLTGCRLFFLQEIQDHRQFVDFSSYNNRPAVHLILFVHTCGHSNNFSPLGSVRPVWCSVGLLESLIQHVLVALGAFHAVCADDAGGPMEVEHHDQLLSLGFQLLDLRLQLRVQRLQPFGFLRRPTKKSSVNYTASRDAFMWKKKKNVINHTILQCSCYRLFTKVLRIQMTAVVFIYIPFITINIIKKKKINLLNKCLYFFKINWCFNDFF